MKSFKNFAISERVWYDKIASMAARNVFASKDYEHALKTLIDVLDRKRSTGTMRHDVDYYANAVARTYSKVDGYELADMYREFFQK